MRVVNQIEIVLRGGAYPFEQDLPAPEVISDGKRSFLLNCHHPVLEDLRASRLFSSDPSVYVALAYQTARSAEPYAVVDLSGEPIRAYLKQLDGETEPALRWVHKTMFLVDVTCGHGTVSGYRLNLSIPGCIETVLSANYTGVGREFINNMGGGFK